MAEDGTDALAMLGLMLELRGFDVILTGDGRGALNAVLAYEPDAVVSDMNMPLLDGLGLCRAVRGVPASASLPVILWSSAQADDPRLLEAIALGGVEFLSKSLAITEIDAALHRILDPDDTSLAHPGEEEEEDRNSQDIATLSGAAAA